MNYCGSSAGYTPGYYIRTAKPGKAVCVSCNGRRDGSGPHCSGCAPVPRFDTPEPAQKSRTYYYTRDIEHRVTLPRVSILEGDEA